jgi:glutamine synthetase
VSFPATILNTIVAESIDELCGVLEADLEQGKSFDDALRALLASEIHEFKHVIFNGDNYSDEWVVEAEARGLLNLRSTMDALPKLVEDKNKALFEKYGVLSHRELESRYEIFVEQYFMTVNIEGESAQQIAQTMIAPAAVRYLHDLLATAESADDLGMKSDGVLAIAGRVNALIDTLNENLGVLAAQNQQLGGDDVVTKARHMRENIIPAMTDVRDVVDRLERIVPDDLWPVPTYREMLFVK